MKAESLKSSGFRPCQDILALTLTLAEFESRKEIHTHHQERFHIIQIPTFASVGFFNKGALKNEGRARLTKQEQDQPPSAMPEDLQAS